MNKAGYGRLRMGKSFTQSLTLKYFWQLMSSVNLLLFKGIEGDVFPRPSPHANLKGPRFRSTATTKMELFDKITLCLSTLERKTIVLVPEKRTLYVV